ncbi:hypothetical protein [Paracoccus sp. NSM]|uniref:hypothetical protein n=1 Tax=Paracoccus sp. NSM TaxID=3457784 RepID=UPI0040372F28
MKVGLWLDRWVLRWISPISSVVLAVLVALLSVRIEDLRERYPRWPGLFDHFEGFPLYRLIIAVAVVAAVGSIYNVWRQRSLKKLRSEIDTLKKESGAVAENVYLLFENILIGLAHQLNLQPEGQERITIYVFNEKRREFVPCGRFSYNHELRKKGRTALPYESGGIKSAWETNWHFDNSFPDPARESDYREYNLTTYSVPRNTSRKLRMKPALLAGRRLSYNDRHVAVIVIESVRRDRFDERQLKEALDGVADQYGRMIGCIGVYVADPSRPSEVGL